MNTAKRIFAALMFSTTAIADDRVGITTDSRFIIDQSNTSMTFSVGKTFVTIHPDGTVKYGDGYTPDTAAKAFWDQMGIERKARNCP